MRTDAEFDNRISGVLAVAGTLAVAAGALLPWVRLDAGGVSLSTKLATIDVALRDSVGGTADGGLLAIVPLAVAALFAIVVLWRRRRRALVSRLIVFLIGAFFVVCAVYMVVDPEDVYAAALTQKPGVTIEPSFGDPDTATDQTSASTDPTSWIANLIRLTPGVSVAPASGAFLMLGGAAAMCLGALIPWTKRSASY